MTDSNEGITKMNSIEILEYANIEVFLPLFGTLMLITVYFLSDGFKKLAVSALILHLLLVIVRLIYYYKDLKSLKEVSSEINQSVYFDFFIEIFNIQAFKLFVYMTFVLLSVSLIIIKALKKR